MNSEAFEHLEKYRDLLVSLRPIFYDFKETLLYLNKEEQRHFSKVIDIFYNKVHNKKTNRNYPLDFFLCKTKNGPTYFSTKLKYQYFINKVSPETIDIVNKIEDLEKEIQNTENKIKNIKNLHRNSYILYILAIKNDPIRINY
jgi:hypothetical protein